LLDIGAITLSGVALGRYFTLNFWKTFEKLTG